MTKSGKFVTCHDWAPKQRNRGHSVSRALCLMDTREGCSTCLHSRFVLRIPMGAGDQIVSCPRWDGSQSRNKGGVPVLYVQIRRETCLRARPFEFCTSCPNSKPAELPRNIEGWYEGWADRKDPHG